MGREDRVVLTIGNSAYANVPNLPNPARDSETVATAFKDIGFTTFGLANQSRAQTLDALTRFGRRANDADWGVFFYSGHAIAVRGVNYIIPVDAKIETDRDLDTEAISLETVLQSLDSARKIKIAILDACRNNPFVDRIQPSTRGIHILKRTAARSMEFDWMPASLAASEKDELMRIAGLARVVPPTSSVIAYSAGESEVALDGDGMTSPFVTALVKRIKESGVEINKVFRLIRDDVFAATRGQQRPAVYSALSGEDFYFVAPVQANAR